MQAYGPAFARVYNELWQGFSNSWAPILYDFIGPRDDKTLLDLCCGTGQFSNYFLKNGYSVTALDLSDDMLRLAADNNREYVRSGKCKIVHADAKDFTLDGKFSVAVSLYDSLNHLENDDALRSCFASVRRAMQKGGVFIFDMNTPKGVRNWRGVDILEETAATLVKRSMYIEEHKKAYMEIIGFSKRDDGAYDKFREMVFNTVFDTGAVMRLLAGAGFGDVELRRCTRAFDVIDSPEDENRIFYVARAE